MSNLFSNLADQQKDTQKEKDVLGGKRKLFPTDAYNAKVDVVYVTKSAGGASALNFIFKVGDQFHRQTEYITSKKGESFYMTKDGKKAALPGYAKANALSKLAIGKEIPALVFEEKIVKIYDFKQKKEVATTVPVAVELTGADICIGIEQQLVNKQAKDQAGNYVDIAETRETNEWTRTFHPVSGHTIAEYDTQQPATFKAAWLAEFQGKVRDLTDKSLRAAAPAAGAPAGTAAAASTPAKGSLFGGN